jgi:hypothetical protein
MELTAKEYADALVKKMYLIHSNSHSDITMFLSKQCALVCCDEIIAIIDNINKGLVAHPKTMTVSVNKDFYCAVKEEINKL